MPVYNEQNISQLNLICDGYNSDLNYTLNIRAIRKSETNTFNREIPLAKYLNNLHIYAIRNQSYIHCILLRFGGIEILF